MVRHENNNLTVIIIIMISIIAVILFINRWIAHETNDVTKNLPGKYTAPVAVEQTATAAKPRRVLIDPMNDPLAPVVPRVDLRAPAPAPLPQKPNPRKIYEPMMNSVILSE